MQPSCCALLIALRFIPYVFKKLSIAAVEVLEFQSLCLVLDMLGLRPAVGEPVCEVNTRGTTVGFG